jgi:hypothetical protein
MMSRAGSRSRVSLYAIQRPRCLAIARFTTRVFRIRDRAILLAACCMLLRSRTLAPRT